MSTLWWTFLTRYISQSLTSIQKFYPVEETDWSNSFKFATYWLNKVILIDDI